MADVKDRFTMTLDEDTREAVGRYMDTRGIAVTSQAVRMLIREAVAVTPLEGAKLAAVRLAYEQTHHFVLKETMTFLRDTRAKIAQFLKDSGAEIQS